MKHLNLLIRKSQAPIYRRLADALRSQIRRGLLKPGERLPPTRELAQQLQIHRHTVMNALAELEAEGWITAHRKRFYEVTSSLPPTFLTSAAMGTVEEKSKTVPIEFARAVSIPDFRSSRGYRFAFPSGFPDLRLFPMREFKSHLYDALSTRDVLAYGEPGGLPRLIEQIKIYLRRMRSVSDREIIVTNGSQEAIFLLAQLLISPGSYVAIECLAYPPAVEALRFAGASLVPVAVDEEGLVVSELERELKTKKIRLLYLTPLHQYPTTVTLSASRRLQLYELACKYKLLILEDDYDHEFHYVSQPVAPLASFDPAGLVMYVSTFSKILFPAARVGFMAVPSAVAQNIAKLKRISSRQNEQLLQAAIAGWMEDGGFEKHLRKMRRTYELRRSAMVQTLERASLQQPGLTFRAPDGGMALWLNLNRNSKNATELLRKSGILVNAEAEYRLDKPVGTHLRLGFSGQTPAENDTALAALFAALKK
jgi:GntR family transcriptional regulator/MocR family aminotransferase